MRKNTFLWLVLLLGISGSVRATPQVIVTLKPIHALVSAVMKTVGTPQLLLSGTESPHTYSLRPSEIRSLYQADLIIWIGPSVETFLAKSLTTLQEKTYVLRLFDIAELTRLSIRPGGLRLENDTEALPKHTHDDIEFDEHIWLDPYNAEVMVQAIADTLSQIDATHATHYARHATDLIKKIKILDRTLAKQLAPVKNQPFLVFHDAYQYIEKRYGLTIAGSVSASPEQRPGAKRLAQLRQFMQTSQVRCLFREPQFKPAWLNVLTEDISIKIGVLDPLGIALPAGEDAYFALLQQLADVITACLADD